MNSNLPPSYVSTLKLVALISHSCPTPSRGSRYLFPVSRPAVLNLIQMRHLAAYLLLVIGGNTSPTAEDVKAVLGAAGIETDDERLNTLITELEGKSLAELVEAGSSKLLIGVGGGGGGGGGGVAVSEGAGASAAPSGDAPAAKKEEKPKEEEVDALDGGMDMFGGGGGGGDY